MRRHRHRCGPDGVEFHIPEGLFAMGGRRGGFRGGFGPFHFDFGDGPSGPFRPSPSRRRRFESGQLRLVLLKLVADEPRPGYDLIRAIEEMTGGE